MKGAGLGVPGPLRIGKGTAMMGLTWKITPALASATALAAVVALGSAPAAGLAQSLPQAAGTHAASGFHVTTVADASTASPDNLLKLLG